MHSEPYWEPTPLYDCLGTPTVVEGDAQVWLVDHGAPLPGVSLTLNTSECPNDASACSLSSILEENAPERSYLSATACLGIVARADARSDGGTGNGLVEPYRSSLIDQTEEMLDRQP